MAELSGQCLCGKVKYTYSGATGKITHCHCNLCRRWHGAAFRTKVSIDAAGFDWLEGEDLVGETASSAEVLKCFCQSCGANLISRYPGDSSRYSLPIGGVVGDLDSYEAMHIFTNYKVPWVEIPAQVEQYPEGPTRDEHGR